MRILIVDDNASMRAMLSALLRSRAYEVVAALEDGARIMETIQQQAPDIVCLDYQLPGRDGLEILREIKETTPQIDVVFMTASEDVSVERMAAEAGAAGFLRKPFGQIQIIEEMQRVCAARQPAAANPNQPRDPAAPDTNPASRAAPGPAPRAGPRFNPRSVVIADDNGSIRSLLKGILSGLDLEVVQLVSNGEEAVQAAKAHRPGVLCLDVEMPVMSGLEALPLIRQASPQTAVVMVTASATREFVEKAAALGAKGYIVKPIRPAYIEAFMKKLFN